MLALGLILFLTAGSDTYGRLDLSFEVNRGQTQSNVKFISRGNGYGLFLTPEEAVLRLTRSSAAIVRMKLVGAKPNPEIQGVDPLVGTAHYLIGSPENHLTDVPNYKKVRYAAVYPGIDVVYYGNQRLLEYDFIVAPGADPSNIKVAFEGVDEISRDSNGDLILKTPGEDLTQRKPIAFQEIEGTRHNVAVEYELSEDGVGFTIGGYDKTRTLVIDPVLVYSTYAGGSTTVAMGDQGYSIAVDDAGNAYITGFTSSADFPTATPRQSATGGGQDAFIMKLNAAGTAVLFSTYLGGSASDEGRAIALDNAGNIIVAGSTLSTNFPIVNAQQTARGGNQDAFVAKLNSSGTAILYSTFLGGAEDDRTFGLATDVNGNAYVTGITASRNFPAIGAMQTANGGGLTDVFVTKLNSNGAIVYSTYVGGFGQDHAYTIGVDPSGNAYVAGFTTSENFPLRDAAQTQLAGGTDDAFLLKLNPSGSALVYSTFFGGTGSDNAVRLVVDPDGSVIVTGITSSQDFPVLNAQLEVLLGTFDAFIIRFNPDGKSITFSTLFGGLGAEGGVGITRDPAGNIYVAGFSDSFELPVVNAIQSVNNGGRDVYVVKMSGDGQTIFYSTYIGGIGADGALAIAVDSAGNAYVTGFTMSPDFPAANAFRPELSGNQDGFIFKIDARDIVSSTPFTILRQGVATFKTGGSSRQASFGFAGAESSSPETRPAGLAILTETQNNTIVSEIGIPAPKLILAGRMFAEVNGQERAVISLANPHDEDASVDFYYTDQMGNSSKFATTTVPAKSHFSRFVTDPPISLGVGDLGTLSFSSSIPLAAAGFDTLTNERSEFVINALPVFDLNFVFREPLVVPHFAEGSGWASEIILVNNSEDTMNGEIRFIAPGAGSTPGAPIGVLIKGGEEPASAYGYEIPPKSMVIFETTRGEEFITGAIHILPHATATPVATVILSRMEDAITISRTTVDAMKPDRNFRLYAEAEGNFDDGERGAIRTGIAISNPSNTPAVVRIDFNRTDGTPTGQSATITIPALGQFARFLHQIPGFENLAAPFKGILQMTSSVPVAVTSARLRINERGNFLAATTGPIVEGAGTGNTLVFPHIAEGGGYTTEFVILGGATGQTATGVLRFLDEAGRPINLTLR